MTINMLNISLKDYYTDVTKLGFMYLLDEFGLHLITSFLTLRYHTPIA